MTPQTTDGTHDAPDGCQPTPVSQTPMGNDTGHVFRQRVSDIVNEPADTAADAHPTTHPETERAAERAPFAT